MESFYLFLILFQFIPNNLGQSVLGNCNWNITGDFDQYPPLLLKADGDKWSSIRPTIKQPNIISIPYGITIVVACSQTSIKAFPFSEAVLGTCLGGKILRVDNEDYNMKDLSCDKSVQENIKQIGQCYKGNFNLYAIEFRFEVSGYEPEFYSLISLNFSVPDYSLMRLDYRVFLKQNNESHPPQFRVMLISPDDAKTELKTEQPLDEWQNSTIQFHTKKDDKISFVGILNSETNFIKLRYVTTEKITSLPERYAADQVGITSEVNKVLNITTNGHYISKNNTYLDDLEVDPSGNSSKSTSNYNNALLEHKFPFDEKPKTIKAADYNSSIHDLEFEDTNYTLNKGNVNNNSKIIDTPLSTVNESSYVNYNSSNTTSSFNGANYSTTLPSLENDKLNTQDTKNNSELINLVATTVVPNISATILDSNINQTLNHTDSSSTSKIFTFFLVIIVISLIVFTFLYWRQKRRKHDDEIPVFSRAATEHGNPAYLDDETELDIGQTSNYRSFR